MSTDCGRINFSPGCNCCELVSIQFQPYQVRPVCQMSFDHNEWEVETSPGVWEMRSSDTLTYGFCRVRNLETTTPNGVALDNESVSIALFRTVNWDWDAEDEQLLALAFGWANGINVRIAGFADTNDCPETKAEWDSLRSGLTTIDHTGTADDRQFVDLMSWLGQISSGREYLAVLFEPIDDVDDIAEDPVLTVDLEDTSTIRDQATQGTISWDHIESIGSPTPEGHSPPPYSGAILEAGQMIRLQQRLPQYNWEANLTAVIDDPEWFNRDTDNKFVYQLFDTNADPLTATPYITVRVHATRDDNDVVTPVGDAVDNLDGTWTQTFSVQRTMVADVDGHGKVIRERYTHFWNVTDSSPNIPVPATGPTDDELQFTVRGTSMLVRETLWEIAGIEYNGETYYPRVPFFETFAGTMYSMVLSVEVGTGPGPRLGGLEAYRIWHRDECSTNQAFLECNYIASCEVVPHYAVQKWCLDSINFPAGVNIGAQSPNDYNGCTTNINYACPVLDPEGDTLEGIMHYVRKEGSGTKDLFTWNQWTSQSILDGQADCILPCVVQESAFMDCFFKSGWTENRQAMGQADDLMYSTPHDVIRSLDCDYPNDGDNVVLTREYFFDWNEGAVTWNPYTADFECYDYTVETPDGTGLTWEPDVGGTVEITSIPPYGIDFSGSARPTELHERYRRARKTDNVAGIVYEYDPTGDAWAPIYQDFVQAFPGPPSDAQLIELNEGLQGSSFTAWVEQDDGFYEYGETADPAEPAQLISGPVTSPSPTPNVPEEMGTIATFNLCYLTCNVPPAEGDDPASYTIIFDNTAGPTPQPGQDPDETHTPGPDVPADFPVDCDLTGGQVYPIPQGYYMAYEVISATVGPFIAWSGLGCDVLYNASESLPPRSCCEGFLNCPGDMTWQLGDATPWDGSLEPGEDVDTYTGSVSFDLTMGVGATVANIRIDYPAQYAPCWTDWNQPAVTFSADGIDWSDREDGSSIYIIRGIDVTITPTDDQYSYGDEVQVQVTQDEIDLAGVSLSVSGGTNC